MWVLIVHAVQVVFAIIVLGLSAYGVHWVPYNALIFALVVCICTFGVCAYLLVSQLVLHSLYNVYAALILHLWMLLFWIVDLGLVANLARLWSGDGYYYSFDYSSIDYSTFIKRDVVLAKREESTTVQAYYGALAAGAVFAAVEFVSWIAVTVILIMTWQKHRSDTTNNAAIAQPSQPPPQYGASQAVPMEKFNQTTVQTQPQQPYQPQQQQQQQQQSFQQQSYTQQSGPYSQQPGGQFGTPYPQDPIPRQETVSPVSSAAYGYAPTAVSELSTPPPTGAAYPPNASELGTASHQHHYTAYDANMPELASRK